MAGPVAVFGKLPVLGDFLDRGLAREVSDRWHGWLVEGLAAARAVLGAGFERAYMAAPVWRLVVPAAALGGTGLAGVLLPSVDSAGRLFPLTLAAPLGDASDPLVLIEAEDWFEMLEDAGRHALTLEGGPDAWLAAVAALPGPPTAPVRGGGGGWVALDTGATGAATALRRRLAGAAASGRALFWSEGSPFVRPGAWIGDALPSGPAFVRLLADPGAAIEEAA